MTIFCSFGYIWKLIFLRYVLTDFHTSTCNKKNKDLVETLLPVLFAFCYVLKSNIFEFLDNLIIQI